MARSNSETSNRDVRYGEAQSRKRQRPSIDRITLNVGSIAFETTMCTLRNIPDSYFGALASGRHHLNREEDGSIFIDRSPDFFPIILEYLRNGGKYFEAPEDLHDRDQLLLEAEFYSLHSMAAKLRRFRIADTHFITVPPNGDRKNRGGSPFWNMNGLPRSAALFEVQNPDIFEATFRLRCATHHNSGDDSADLMVGDQNEAGIFVGIAPADVDISEAWEKGEWPLPELNRANSVIAGMPATRGRPPEPTPRETALKFWPDEVSFPPALRRGFFCALMESHFGPKDPEHAWDSSGPIAQFIAEGDFVAAAKPQFSLWNDRMLCVIGFRFTRVDDRCTIEFRLEDEDRHWINRTYNLRETGLDWQAPYRPVIFFNKKIGVAVENDMADGDS